MCSLCTWATTSRRMGAVRTAGSGSELEASRGAKGQMGCAGDRRGGGVPPVVERTLTVGLEAILLGGRLLLSFVCFLRCAWW